MINITARGFELKEGPKIGIEKELKRVEKMLPETADFNVTLSKMTGGYKCDITVKHTGSFIRGEAVAERIEPSIDMCTRKRIVFTGFDIFSLVNVCKRIKQGR